MNRVKHVPLSVRKTAIASALAALTAPGMAQDLVLEEVIVTAQKRESTIQDIAATVNVVTGESIDKFSSLGFADLESQTAGLTLATPNARSQTIAMRGVAVDAEAGVDATVTVYFNDQLVTNNIAFGQLFDLERVEVLRGPQGALQGRSSPAGAINIHSRSADLTEPDGYVQATVGDNEGFNGQVAYGMPLIEGVLAARVAAVYDTSYARDVENKTTGLDDPELEATAYRANLVWQITDDLVADLTYQNFDRDIDDPLGISGVDNLGERPTLKPEDKIALAPRNNDSHFEYDYLNLQLNWAIGDLELASVTGWSDEDRYYLEENDRANYVQNPLAPTFQTSDTSQEIFIQELRLSSSDNDFWDWMIGAYYQDQDVAGGLLPQYHHHPAGHHPGGWRLPIHGRDLHRCTGGVRAVEYLYLQHLLPDRHRTGGGGPALHGLRQVPPGRHLSGERSLPPGYPGLTPRIPGCRQRGSSLTA